jgi:hypothetical protein
MARIRTIKPEFWTNDKILSVSQLTRLLFIGMWNFADDYGRMDFAPISIKARIFPNDATTVADVKDMLNELCSNDLITIYSAKDKEYIEITGWDHQKIDKRQASKIPGPFEDDSAIRGIPPTPPDLSPTPTPVMEGKGREGIGGEGEKKDAASAAIDSEKVFFDQAAQTVGRPLAAKLLKAKGGNVALAHAALLTASTKSEPREYLGAIIRGREQEGKSEWAF